MKDKKKFFILVLSVIGIICLVLGVIFLNNKTTNSNEEPKPNEPSNNAPVKLSMFEISNLEVLKNTPNRVAMGFKIVNTSKEKIDNKSLFIKYYEKDKLVHTYEKIVTDLEANDSKYMQVNREFEYKEITKIEFQLGDEVVSLIPTFVD